MAPVRQHVGAGKSEDIPGEVRAGMRRLHSRVRPGTRIGVGVGSRGIAGLPTVIRCVIEELRALLTPMTRSSTRRATTSL